MAEFEIKVSELNAGGRQYDFPVSVAWLHSALVDLPEGDRPLRPDPAFGEGEVSVWAEKSGEDVLVRGRVRVRLLAECARCLGDAPVAVDASLTALYTARSGGLRPAADKEEFGLDEVDREFYTGEHVVLDALVREHVLLEVPMKPLCSEHCTGIEVPASVRGPAEIGGVRAPDGLQMDPRLAPLLGLYRGEISATQEPEGRKNDDGGTPPKRAAGPAPRVASRSARPKRLR
jgi:uncharacterized protein